MEVWGRGNFALKGMNLRVLVHSCLIITRAITARGNCTIHKPSTILRARPLRLHTWAKCEIYIFKYITKTAINRYIPNDHKNIIPKFSHSLFVPNMAPALFASGSIPGLEASGYPSSPSLERNTKPNSKGSQEVTFKDWTHKISDLADTSFHRTNQWQVVYLDSNRGGRYFNLGVYAAHPNPPATNQIWSIYTWARARSGLGYSSLSIVSRASTYSQFDPTRPNILHFLENLSNNVP